MCACSDHFSLFRNFLLRRPRRLLKEHRLVSGKLIHGKQMPPKFKTLASLDSFCVSINRLSKAKRVFFKNHRTIQKKLKERNEESCLLDLVV